MGKLREHAERELRAAGYDLETTEEGPNKWMVENVLELIDVFSEQGHSGMSGPYAVNLFAKLAMFQPLVPLTGEDSEWVDVGEGTFQNKRCYSVFKDADGNAYNITGRVFREPSGECFTNHESRVAVTFPYTPKTEYVDVPAQEPDH